MPNLALDKEFKLNDVAASMSLVRQHLKKKISVQQHGGTLTPNRPMEHFIVAIIQSMSCLLKPLNVSQGLSLTN
jgi:hypothetical protein